MAGRESLDELLTNLKLKNIEELLTGDCFNLDHLSKSTSMHPMLINQLLQQIHTQLTVRQLEQQTTGINFRNVVGRWHQGEQILKDTKEIDMQIAKGDIVQILGRTNAGKSYLLNELVVQALQNGFEVLYFDSGNNMPALKIKVRQRLSHLSHFKTLKLRHFPFSSLSQLFIHLFLLRKQLKEKPQHQYFIFIDTISRNQQPQLQNTQAISSHEFKYAEKARIIFKLLSNKTAGIVYTNRMSHSSGMFTPVYSKNVQIQSKRSIDRRHMEVTPNNGITSQIKQFQLILLQLRRDNNIGGYTSAKQQTLQFISSKDLNDFITCLDFHIDIVQAEQLITQF